jgi:hypothetical protein
MCWSEQTHYSACGHYIRDTYVCPFQQERYRTEPDWLSECRMHDIQPAKDEMGRCGRCEPEPETILARDDDNDDGSENDAPDSPCQEIALPVVERDGAAQSDGRWSTGGTILSGLWTDGVITPPTPDSPREIRCFRPGLHRQQSSTTLSDYSSASSRSSASTSACEEVNRKRMSAPASYNDRPIDYALSLRTPRANRAHTKGFQMKTQRMWTLVATVLMLIVTKDRG